MKRTILVFITLISIFQAGYGQIRWGDYSQSFPDDGLDKPSNIAIITTIRSINSYFWNDGVNDDFAKLLAKDASFKNIRPKQTVARVTFDTAQVHFFLHGVNQANAGNFEFRVSEYEGAVIVPWQTISRFNSQSVIDSSGMNQMGYLGGYKVDFDKVLIVDVKRKGDEKIIASSVITRKVIKPVIAGVYTTNQLNLFFNRLTHPWDVTPTTATGQEKNVKIKGNENGLIFYLKGEIYKKEHLSYELIRNNKVVIPWRSNDFDNSFIWLKDLAPGSYQIKIRYEVQPDNVTEYSFEVEPLWYQSTLFKIVVGLLIVVFFAALLFFILLIRQKRKTHDESSKRTKVQLELKAIYAQLNPHFVFNALSSIQGLINKQDIKGANSYLSDFARLLRESLNNSNKEEVSLNEEKLMLDTYLKLEQLRFGFAYEINIDEKINVFETDVPVLLLQPLIENAVKHGVSALQERGKIIIDINDSEGNMVVTIADNGSGFILANRAGFGLKLTHDRIKLLNELDKTRNIQFEIQESSMYGTKIILTFKAWFQ